MAREKRILVAPLDWGLGHATRCIPLIRELLARGARPYLATSGRAFHLLEKEFPGLPLLPLASYGVRYPGERLLLQLALQAPRILAGIWREHAQVRQLVGRYRLDGVISDNRLGAFSKQVKSVYLTHQLHFMAPVPRLAALAAGVHHWFIRRYDECWVPDTPLAPGLAGALSHPPLSRTRYIGPLSRLSPSISPAEFRYDLLVLLSGPEPQRTRLEERLLEQLSGIDQQVLLVQGITEKEERWQAAPHIQCISYLRGEALEAALKSSRLVVCRSGYSTIMDLARLGHRALFIPTPGQTEQLYLARLLRERQIAYAVEQSEIDLPADLKAAEAYRGFPGEEEWEGAGLGKAVSDFLGGL